jgi:hypothetical protein
MQVPSWMHALGQTKYETRIKLHKHDKTFLVSKSVPNTVVRACSKGQECTTCGQLWLDYEALWLKGGRVRPEVTAVMYAPDVDMHRSTLGNRKTANLCGFCGLPERHRSYRVQAQRLTKTGLHDRAAFSVQRLQRVLSH